MFLSHEFINKPIRLGLFNYFVQWECVVQAQDDSVDSWQFREHTVLASGIIFVSFQKIMIGMQKKSCQDLHSLVLLASMKLFESR